MVALSCLQSSRALALAALVVGFAPVPSFAASQIVCQRNEEQCFYNCKYRPPPPRLIAQCVPHCRFLHTLCLNTPPTTNINSGTSKAVPDLK